VTVRLRDAAAVTVPVDVARGAVDQPLTDGDLEDKLRELCSYGQSGCDPEPLIEAVWTPDRMDDISAVVKLASGKT
jgi:hypothetical protein